MMDLRKTCNHPYLIEYPLTEDGLFYRADEDMVDICGKLKVLDQMLEELMIRGHKVLVFSQMTRLLDILADYLNHRQVCFKCNVACPFSLRGLFLKLILMHFFYSGRLSFLVQMAPCTLWIDKRILTDSVMTQITAFFFFQRVLEVNTYLSYLYIQPFGGEPASLGQ